MTGGKKAFFGCSCDLCYSILKGRGKSYVKF